MWAVEAQKDFPGTHAGLKNFLLSLEVWILLRSDVTPAEESKQGSEPSDWGSEPEVIFAWCWLLSE